jgi:hypothetical protein
MRYLKRLLAHVGAMKLGVFYTPPPTEEELAPMRPLSPEQAVRLGGTF